MLDNLGQFGGGNGFILDALDFCQQRVARGGEFIRIHHRAHSEQTLVGRAVSPGVGRGDQPLPLPHFPKQARTPPAAQKRRQNIQGRHVRMPDIGDVPGKVEKAKLNRGLFNHVTRPGLPGFARQHHWRQRPGFALGESLADLADDRLRLHIACHDKEHVVGHVPFPVISQNILRLERVENLRVADDGEAIRAFGVSHLKKPPARPSSRVVLVHVHFAADDIQFLVQFLRGQTGVLHDVAQNINGDSRAGVGDIDMKDRAIKGSVGVHVSARLLHLLVNAAARTRRGALEKHVLEDMGQTRAEPFAFADAARIAPGLGRDNRRAVIFPNDEHQPVFQSHQPHVRRNTRNLPFPRARHDGDSLLPFWRRRGGAFSRRGGACHFLFCADH